MLEKIKKFGWGYVLLFIMLLAVGVCLLSFNNTLEIVAIVMGVIMMLFGIVFFILTLANKHRGVNFAFRITFSIIALVCGAVTAISKSDAIEILVSFIALFLIMDGSFKLQTTATSKRYKLALWWLILIPAVLTIIGGFIAMRISPASNDVPIILGITVIIDAIANLLSAFYIAKYESVMKNDIIDEYLIKTKQNDEKDNHKATQNGEQDNQ